jgi:hypothetical protein
VPCNTALDSLSHIHVLEDITYICVNLVVLKIDYMQTKLSPLIEKHILHSPIKLSAPL